MKKLTQFFLLGILGFCFVGITHAKYGFITGDTLEEVCSCGYSYYPKSIYLRFISIVLIASFLIFPLWKAFKKTGQKPWYSIIPLGNIYTLSKITINKIWRIIFTGILTLLCCYSISLCIFGDSIREYIIQKDSYGCCEANVTLNIFFLIIPLVLFILFSITILLQLYLLTKKLGWKTFLSIIFILLFLISTIFLYSLVFKLWILLFPESYFL